MKGASEWYQATASVNIRLAVDLNRLIVWREAVALAASILSVAGRIKGPGRRHVAVQMIRAAESIPANIAEGVGRGFSKDCVRFLKIARGSGIELDTHLQQAIASRRLDILLAKPLLDHTRRVRFLLRRYQEYVQGRLNSL